MKTMYHLTAVRNVDSILKEGLLLSRSGWGPCIYLTDNVSKCLRVYPHMEEELLTILEVRVFEVYLKVDRLHPATTEGIVGYSYCKDIPPQDIVKVIGTPGVDIPLALPKLKYKVGFDVIIKTPGKGWHA